MDSKGAYLFHLFNKSLFLLTVFITFCHSEEIHTSKVFIKKIDPSLFNWTDQSSTCAFRYRATLENSPDLPRWLSYLYCERHKAGFVYGVPPSNYQSFNMDVIGINKNTYETRHTVIHLNVTDKPDPAKFEVHLKVDNLNVQDLFDAERLDKLLGIFMNILWRSSKDYLFVTFLDSAIKLGARLPLIPEQGEGVVVHIGSRQEFSEELLNLQEELKPLLKFTSCPRDFKRTTVDRHFRAQGFLLDWCSFRLVKLEGESGNAHYKEAEADVMGHSSYLQLPDKYHLPIRDYSSEILMTLIMPGSTLFILWMFLSFILCFQHDSVDDPESDNFFDTIFISCEEYTRDTIGQFEGVERNADTLSTLSVATNRNTESSPRLSCDRMDSCRPNPPPYSATKKLIYEDS